jgi:type IV secretory pathway component VirB8
MSGKWVVRIRESYKNPRQPNKKQYVTLTFAYASEVRKFLESLVNYEMPPLDVKFYYDRGEEPKK